MKKRVKNKGFKKVGLKKIRESHVKQRARERFGIYLTKRDLGQIVRIIQEGKAFLLRNESNTKKHYKVEYAGIEMRVIYSKAHRCLLTVIPLKNSQI